MWPKHFATFARNLHPHYGWLTLLTLAAHGLLLLNDGVYTIDSWVQIALPFQQGGWERIWFHLSEWGRPFFAPLYWAFSYFPGWVYPIKVGMFALLWASALLIYEITRHVTDNRLDGLLVAGLATTFPAYQTQVVLVMVGHQFHYTLFLAGVWLWLRGLRRGGGLPWRVLALAVLGYAGLLASLLALFYAVFLLFAVWQAGWRFAPRAYIRFTLRNLDFAVLPFIVWALIGVVVRPPDSVGAGYYTPRLSADTLNTLRLTLQNSVLEPLNISLGILVAMPSAWLLVALVGSAVYARTEHLSGPPPPLATAGIALGLGSVFLLLGIVPYALLGFHTEPSGWLSRHALLIPLAMAILLSGATRVLPRRVQASLVSVLVLLFSLTMIQSYIDWQASWIKDRAILHDLATLEPPPATQYWVDDRYELVPELRHQLSLYPLMVHLWGAEVYSTTPGTAAASAVWGRMYYTQGVTPQSCQAVLTITPGDEPQRFNDPLGLTLRYYAFRAWGGAPLDSFLDNLLAVEIRPLLAPQASDCAAQAAYLQDQPGALADSPAAWGPYTAAVQSALAAERQLAHTRQSFRFAQTNSPFIYLVANHE
ncbi:MAG: hypothetical protein ACLFTK_05565 [Anaerolineales bacterium]